MMSSTSSFLDSYEPLDIIGNGSFGIIRKVKRKQDGIVSPSLVELLQPFNFSQILARKEIDFERMNERDRKQVVAEVFVCVVHTVIGSACPDAQLATF
jgi:NIMA (never in mitosis gene a)-related kinase 2